MVRGELNITLHHFRNAEHPAPTSEELLDNAARLVISTTRETQWFSPPILDTAQFSIGSRYYEFRSKAPRSGDLDTSCGRIASQTARLWEADVIVSDEEVWALADLDEFDHSHLHHLLDCEIPKTADPLITPSQPSKGRIACQDDTVSIMTRSSEGATSQPNKRRKLDESLLRSILPPPHFHPSRATPDDADFQSASFFKVQISPIPPHTLESAQSYIGDPFARLAWIVPVRGRLQWDGASIASIFAKLCDPDSPGLHEDLPVAPTSELTSSELIWTQEALAAFWEFLKSLREAGHLGPLSLSFHSAPKPASSSMQLDSYVGSHKQTTVSTSTSVSGLLPAITPGASGVPLRMMDYIKLYHDARYTKAVRNILNAWSYKMNGRKIRLLKEARLVLVDERSRGILMC